MFHADSDEYLRDLTHTRWPVEAEVCWSRMGNHRQQLSDSGLLTPDDI